MTKNLIFEKTNQNSNIENILLELQIYLRGSTHYKINILSIEMEARKIRNIIFPERMFGEASWDILLDLYYAHLNGKVITVSSACIASAVPGTTALRHLQSLQEHGYIRRYKDLSDSRKIIIQLTEKCLKLMEEWIAKVELRITL